MDEIYKKRRKKVLIIIAVAVYIAFMAIMFIGYSNKPTESEINEHIVALHKSYNDSIDKVTEENLAKNNPYQWRYSEETDPMTSKTKHFAQIFSTTSLNFEFPYNGGSEVDLFIRNVGARNELILRVSKGQFMTSIGGQQSVRIRFDQEQPLTYGYNSAADGSADVIFIDSPNQIISKFKKAHSFIIEVAFYQEGNKHLEFSYKDFIWNH